MYSCTRRFIKQTLPKFNISFDFFNPLDLHDLTNKITPTTKCIFLESPGSYTFEITDTIAVVSIAKQHNLLTIYDNTWATPLIYNPLNHGVDIAIQSLSKFYGGHSDIIMGLITTNNKQLFDKIFNVYNNFGLPPSPEDAYLVLRGIRTLHTRLATLEQNALQVAQYLDKHPKVLEVLHPALPSFKYGHNIWKRDLGRSTGLFSFTIPQISTEKLHKFINGMQIFKIGLSWGGYESLILPIELDNIRSIVPWQYKAHCIRLYIGLENPADLIADLEQQLQLI